MSTTVLLVDDSENVRKAILHLLQCDPDIQVLAEGTNFAQTIEFAMKLHPQVIMMDLHMRDETAFPPSQVKSCLNGSRLLAMSIWTDDENKILAKAMGAITLLDKANLRAELIPAIRLYARECFSA